LCLRWASPRVSRALPASGLLDLSEQRERSALQVIARGARETTVHGQSLLVRGVQQHLPARTGAEFRQSKRDRLVMCIEQQQKIVVAHWLTAPVGLVQCLTGEIHTKRAREFLAPFGVVHLASLRREPGDVLDSTAADRASLEEASATVHRVLAA